MTSYFRTHTGRRIYPLSPRVQAVCIFDIARSLSHLCRFLGHTTAFYSVAQHSVLVSQQTPPQDALWGLLHDASEAYLGDLPTPIKQRPLMFVYRWAERRLMESVCHQFRLPLEMPRSVRDADRAVLATEFRDVTTVRDLDWIAEECGAAPSPTLRIEPWRPEIAEARFLSRFAELTA